MENSKTLNDTQKIVMAGMKLLYSNETRSMLDRVASNTGPLPEILTANIVGILQILWEKSGGKLPPAAIAPAAMILLYELASFLKEAGKEMDDEDVQIASQMLPAMLKELFKQLVPKGGKPNTPMQQTQPPMQPPQPQMQRGGLINQGV